MPKLLNVPPYTVDQIVEILAAKSSAAGEGFPKNAIEFCARKVAAASGDLRKALDVCRFNLMLSLSDERRSISVFSHAIRLAEKEYLATENIVAQKDCFASENLDANAQKILHLQKGKITFDHLRKAVLAMTGTALAQQVAGLNLHQQTLLVCACLMQRESRGKEWTMGLVIKRFMLYSSTF